LFFSPICQFKPNSALPSLLSPLCDRSLYSSLLLQRSATIGVSSFSSTIVFPSLSLLLASRTFFLPILSSSILSCAFCSFLETYDLRPHQSSSIASETPSHSLGLSGAPPFFTPPREVPRAISDFFSHPRSRPRSYFF